MDKKAIRRWHRAFYFPNAIRVLRIKQALITSAFMLYSIAGFSQQDKMVTFGVDKEALPKALKRLAKAADVLIGYPAGETEKAGKVSLPTAQRTLNKTLELLLKGTSLSFRFVDGRVVIFKPAPATIPQESSRKFIDVTGKVVDETGAALPGISISLQGTDRGTTTNSNGLFGLGQVPEDGVIVAQGIGFPAQTFTAIPVLVIQLNRSVSDLDEVQVIAYGTSTKRLNTGNVVTVNAADIEKQPITNALAALQGRVPGLLVTQTSGVPGSAFKVQLRGQSYIDADFSQNDPLIIIDGVPFEAGNQARNQVTSAANNPTSISEDGLSPLNMIPPSEIESISVLKDADATSIYGSRGANGVILITTKKGKSGSTKFTLNTNTGWSKVSRTVKFLSGPQYLEMRREAFKNDSLVLSAVPGNPGFAPDLTLWDTTQFTDFTDLLVGNTANKYDVNLSVSGGTAYTQFLIAGSYHRESTVYGRDFANRILGLQANLSHKSRDDRFSVSLASLYSNDNTQLPTYDLSQFVRTVPNLRLYDSLGNINWQDHGVEFIDFEGSKVNPLYSFNRKYNSQTDNLNTNIQIAYKVLPFVTARVSSGYNLMMTDEKGLNPSTSLSPVQVSQGAAPYAFLANSVIRSWISEPQLEYAQKIGRSKLNFLVGGTFQNKVFTSSYITARNYNSDLLLGSLAAAGAVTASNNDSKYRYSAVFGRLNYNYTDRYIVNITARRDGSSRFAPENRWSNFGSIAGAWIFSNENFIKSLPSKVFSFGKLRSSYGSSGNDQIGDYKYLSLWTNTTFPYNGVPGLYPSRLYNADYRWELIKKFEIGLDLGFVKDRILLSSVFYLNKSCNQLVTYKLPFQTGFANVVQNFPGVVQNKGWEFMLSTQNIKNQVLQWQTTFNITLPENKLVSFPGLERSSYANLYQVGQSLTITRGYKYLGMNQATGMYTFEDVDNNGVLNATDYQWFGDRDPDFYGGLQNNLSYKGWNLNFLFDFRQQKGTNYLAQLNAYAPGQMSNQPDLVLDRWQRPGDNARLQRFTAGQNNVSYPYLAAATNFTISDAKYTDASFVKLRNIALYYSVPESCISKTKIKLLRLYAQAQNVLTITKYKGADPEVQNLFQLSPLTTVVLGLQTSF